MPDIAPLQFIRGRRVKESVTSREPKPDWLKVRAPGSPNYLRLRGLMRELRSYATVCEKPRSGRSVVSPGTGMPAFSHSKARATAQ